MRSDQAPNRKLTPEEREAQELAEAMAASLESQAGRKRGETRPNAHQIGDLDQEKLKYSDPIMQAGADELHQKYPGMRIIRGDGNCYYRAIMYGLLEQVIIAPNRAALCGELIHRFRVLRDKSSPGDYEKIDNLILKLQLAQANELWSTVAAFEADMRDPDSDTDAALIWSARLMCAQATREHSFVEGIFGHYPGRTEQEKKQAYLNVILTYGEDAQDAALSASLLPIALGINSTVTYFGKVEPPNLKESESRKPPKCETSTIAENDGAPLNLTVHVLFRPGHYDLLYSNAQVNKLLKHAVNDLRNSDALEKKVKALTQHFLTLLTNPNIAISHLNASRKLVMRTLEACEPEQALGHLMSLNDALAQQKEHSQSNQHLANRIDVELIIVQAKIAELIDSPHP